jgi:hypothetical protein
MKLLLLVVIIFVTFIISSDAFRDKFAEKDRERNEQLAASKAKSTTIKSGDDTHEATTHGEGAGGEDSDHTKSPKSKDGHDHDDHKKKHSKDDD